MVPCGDAHVFQHLRTGPGHVRGFRSGVPRSAVDAVLGPADEPVRVRVRHRTRGRAMKRRAKWTTDDPFGLTFQERRIVELLRAGRRTRDICTILNLTTTRSLYTYCYRIFRKTGTHHRLEL